MLRANSDCPDRKGFSFASRFKQRWLAFMPQGKHQSLKAHSQNASLRKRAKKSQHQLNDKRSAGLTKTQSSNLEYAHPASTLYCDTDQPYSNTRSFCNFTTLSDKDMTTHSPVLAPVSREPLQQLTTADNAEHSTAVFSYTPKPPTFTPFPEDPKDQPLLDMHGFEQLVDYEEMPRSSTNVPLSQTSTTTRHQNPPPPTFAQMVTLEVDDGVVKKDQTEEFLFSQAHQHPLESTLETNRNQKTSQGKNNSRSTMPQEVKPELSSLSPPNVALDISITRATATAQLLTEAVEQASKESPSALSIIQDLKRQNELEESWLQSEATRVAEAARYTEYESLSQGLDTVRAALNCANSWLSQLDGISAVETHDPTQKDPPDVLNEESCPTLGALHMPPHPTSLPPKAKRRQKLLTKSSHDSIPTSHPGISNQRNQSNTRRSRATRCPPSLDPSLTALCHTTQDAFLQGPPQSRKDQRHRVSDSCQPQESALNWDPTWPGHASHDPFHQISSSNHDKHPRPADNSIVQHSQRDKAAHATSSNLFIKDTDKASVALLTPTTGDGSLNPEAVIFIDCGTQTVEEAAVVQLEHIIADRDENLRKLRTSLQEAETQICHLKAVIDAEKANTLHAKDMWLRESERASTVVEDLRDLETQLARRDAQLADLSKEHRCLLREVQSLRGLLHPHCFTSSSQNKRFHRKNKKLLDDLTAIEDTSSHGSITASFLSRSIKEGSDMDSRLSVFSDNSCESETPHPVCSSLGSHSIHQKHEACFSSSVEYSAHFAKFRDLLLFNDAVLYENHILQIGIKAEYNKHAGVVQLFLGNCTNGELHNLVSSTALCTVAMEKALTLTCSPLPPQWGPKEQLCQSIVVSCLAPFERFPFLRLSFLLPDGSPNLVEIPLPIAVTKFMKGHSLSYDDFTRLWRQDAFVLHEAAIRLPIDKVRFGHSLLAVARVIQATGAFTLSPGYKEGTDRGLAFVGAFPPPDSSFPGPTSLVLVRYQARHRSSQPKKEALSHIAVRSDSLTLSRAIRSILHVLLATPLETTISLSRRL